MRLLFLAFICLLSSSTFAGEPILIDKIATLPAIITADEPVMAIKVPTDSVFNHKHQKSAGDLIEAAGRQYTIARIISVATATVFIIASANVAAQRNAGNRTAEAGGASLLFVAGQGTAIVFNFLASDKLKKAGRVLNAQERQRRLGH